MSASVRNKAPAGFRAGGNSGTPLDKASTGAHAADEAARRAKPAIDKVAETAHSAVDTATGAAVQKKLLSDSCAYVSAHPMKSLGMAIVVGLLLGRVVR